MSTAAIRALVWAATVLAVCAIAAWRGRRDEQLAAGLMLAAWAVTMVVERGFEQTEWGILLVDIAALAGFFWIALRSERYWPIFAAGFHLLAVVTHLARLADSGVGQWAYVTAEIIWGYMLALVIGYGAWTAPAAQPVSIDRDPAGATRR
jgi:hypothetical protein